MKRSSVVTAAVAAFLLTITGCAPSAEDAAPTPTASETETPAKPEPTSTPSEYPKPTPTPSAASTDRTYEAQTVGGGIVSKAIEEPAGTITIYTDISQPFSDTQETARYEALIACEAVRTQMGATTVIVFDASDKPFAFFNGSNYPECGLSR